MIKYILMRMLWAVIVLIGILTTTFIFLKLQPITVPNDLNQKAVWLLKQENLGYMTSIVIEKANEPEQADAVARAEHDPKAYTVYQDRERTVLYVYRSVPILVQYFRWVNNVVFHFDWGTSVSMKINQPVTEILNSGISYSFKINIFVMILEIPLGLALGIFSAIKKDTIFDNISQILIMVFISLPSFVVISLLMKWLGSDLGWVPFMWPSGDSTASTQARGYIIPVLSMTIGSIAGLARAVRAELAEGLTSDYVLLARTKGLTKRQAIFRHALRNSLLPIIPGLLFSFVGLISGSAIIEMIYGIPGAGSLMLQALQRQDYNVIMYDTAFYGFIGLVCGIFMDISYGFIDPRIKMGASNG
ncbi:MAG: ABC transporter permease [Acholeplasmatales bacterium]|jgi:oligopeptide transport system permease protein|nr:ABC transporter permease [Acholeplasmatales bacterium]